MLGGPYLFTERARRIIALAEEEARRLHHDYVGSEHLLLGVLREGGGRAVKVLANLGVQPDRVRAQVESGIVRGEKPAKGPIALAPDAQKVIDLAADEAHQFGHHHIGSEHLLFGLLREGEGMAAAALQALGITLEAVDAEVERILAVPTVAEEAPAPIQVPGGQIWRRPEVVVSRQPVSPPPPELPKGLASLMDDLRKRFDAKHGAREQSLALCRDALRHSANAIRGIHRNEFPAAEKLLAEARAMLEQATKALADHQDVFYAGFVHNAAKEFAEASLTLAIISGRPLPSPADLGVEAAAYVNGLGEAVGELRRHLLDSLRRGDVERCEGVLAVMDDIYTALVTMDYPEAITGGLRRTADAMRGILERTRGDLTLALVQRKLERRLEEFQGKLPSAP